MISRLFGYLLSVVPAASCSWYRVCGGVPGYIYELNMVCKNTHTCRYMTNFRPRIMIPFSKGIFVVSSRELGLLQLSIIIQVGPLKPGQITNRTQAQDTNSRAHYIKLYPLPSVCHLKIGGNLPDTPTSEVLDWFLLFLMETEVQLRFNLSSTNMSKGPSVITINHRRYDLYFHLLKFSFKGFTGVFYYFVKMS